MGRTLGWLDSLAYRRPRHIDSEAQPSKSCRPWSVSQQVTALGRDRVLTLQSSYRVADLAVVRVTSGGGIHRGTDRDHHSREDPGPQTGRETRRQRTVINLASHGEAVKGRGRKIQALVVWEPVGGGINVSGGGCDDTLVRTVHARDLASISIEQPAFEIFFHRHERSRPLIDVEEHFVGQPAGNAAFPELAQIIEAGIGVEF